MRRSIRRGPHSALLQQRSGGESQQFERIIREDMVRWGKVIRDAGVVAQ
jgi:hypothetical protein